MSADLWHLKAHALLLPWTAADESLGELRGRLGAPPFALTSDEALLLHECACDAHDAQVVLDLRGTAPPAAADARLKHPLSAAQLDGGTGLRVTDLEQSALHALDTWRPDNGAASYRHLWRALCGPDSVASRMASDGRLPDHSVAAHRSLTAALVGARHAGARPALLYVHVGPVQGFISTARRTHDLWVGSFTLTYLVACAARAVAETLGPDAIVSPSLAHVPLLDHLLFGRNVERLERLRSSLPNKLLAIVPENRGKEVARTVAEKIHGTWTAIAAHVQARLNSVGHLDTSAWKCFDEQIGGHLEIDAVLRPWPRTRLEVRDALQHAELWRAASDAPEGEGPLAWWLDGDAPAEERTGVAYGALFDLTYRVLAAQRATPRLDVAPSGDSRPKCALCGQREQMGPVAEHRQLHQSREFWRALSGRLRERGDAHDGDRPPASLQLPEGEGLCAVCLTKRFAPDAFFGTDDGQLGLNWWKRGEDRPLLRFPSVESIASAPCRWWLSRASELAPVRKAWVQALRKLHDDHLDFDPPGNLLPQLGTVGRNDPFLNFDGEWLYEMSYDAGAVWRRYFPNTTRDDDKPRFEKLAVALDDAKKKLRSLLHPGLSTPSLPSIGASPYYAVLVLDGDRMGQWLTGRHKCMPLLREIAAPMELPAESADRRRPLFPALHGELSRRVGDLAQELYPIVDQHLGRVVYTGGDDLMALLPLATALPCLRRIRASVQSPRFLGERVTISAGIAIAHVHDPLSRTLLLARDAEQHAKKRRDAFTVAVDKRSGAELRLTLPFEIVGATQAERDVLDCVLDLLRPPSDAKGREDERWPLRSVSVAHRLEEELRLLGLDDGPQRPDVRFDSELLEMFDHRVRVLLDFKQPLKNESSRAARLLHALLSDSGNHPTRPRDVVNLLLLAHFLLREEHGLGTHELLAGLAAGEAR